MNFKSKLGSRFGMVFRSLLGKLGVASLCVAAQTASAQVVTGTWAPTSAGASTSATLTLGYTGFATQNIGYKFRVYFNGTALTFNSAANLAAPGGAYQGDSGVTADGGDGDADAATDSYVELNWVDLGNAWPTNAAGNLGTVSFTTSASFNGTSVNLRESAIGPQARGVVGSAAALAGPPLTITLARQSAASVADDGTNHTFRVTASAAPGANLTVNLARSVTGITGGTLGCGATITILTGQTFADCNMSATNTVPFDGPGTASVQLQSGAGYVVGTASAVTGSITNDDLPTVTLSPVTANVPDNGASQTVTATLSAPAPAGGFVVPLTALAPNARYGGTCVSLASLTVAAGATTATCTVIGTANTTAGDGSVGATVALNCTSTCTNSGTGTSIVTVIDDDVPVFNVTCVPTSIPDSGATSTCTFRNTLATTSSLNVAFTPTPDTARHTITGCTSPIVVPASAANTAVATCTVTGVLNTTPGDGSVIATITPIAGTGYSPGTAGSVTVTDDDIVNVTVTPTGTSEGGNALFSVACTGPAGAQVTGLTYTVTTVAPDAPGVVAQPVGTLTCGTANTISVPTVNDSVIGNSRSVIFVLAGPGAVVAGGTPNLPTNLTFVAAVADDDRPTVVPTMGALGLGLLGLLIAGFGALVQRRRK